MKRGLVNGRGFWVIPVDAFITFIIVFLSFLANIGFSGFTGDAVAPTLIYCGCISIVTVLAFIFFGVYKMITSNFGLVEATKVLAIAVGVQILGLVIIICCQSVGLPEIGRFCWGWLISTIAVGFALPSVRLMCRVIVSSRRIRNRTNLVNTLVIGAGASGKIVIDESRRNSKNHNKVVAFIDDDVNKINRTFAGVPVFGPISKIGSVIDYYNIEEVIVAISDVSRERLHEIFDLLVESKVRVRRMPTLDEMQGPNDMRIIDVDVNDLLSRAPISLDNSEVTNMLNGKTVLVTGAGGSIGSELVKQIFKTHPSTLVLFDIYENSTYDIQQSLRMKMREENITNINLVTLIGSTYDEKTVEKVIKKYRPDYIYHAAAYKHVPLMEDSPAEAIRTNVIGTYNVAKMADKYEVKKMVLVSTDKAVRPTNTMGATKRFAETIIQYFSAKSKHTAYAAVRFGNVLGSNGSVVPLFKKQIEKGGPITLTHKDVIRYFMTIPEAVSLILQCGLFATGGEIFILDMGKPVKIYDLAERLIRQAGLTPNVDIKIEETGLRPGEKLFEELLLDKTKQTKTENKKIFIEEKSEEIAPIEKEIKEIVKVFDLEDNLDIKKMLKSIINTYTIDERR